MKMIHIYVCERLNHRKYIFSDNFDAISELTVDVASNVSF